MLKNWQYGYLLNIQFLVPEIIIRTGALTKRRRHLAIAMRFFETIIGVDASDALWLRLICMLKIFIARKIIIADTIFVVIWYHGHGRASIWRQRFIRAIRNYVVVKTITGADTTKVWRLKLTRISRTFVAIRTIEAANLLKVCSLMIADIVRIQCIKAITGADTLKPWWLKLTRIARTFVAIRAI